METELTFTQKIISKSRYFPHLSTKTLFVVKVSVSLLKVNFANINLLPKCLLFLEAKVKSTILNVTSFPKQH